MVVNGERNMGVEATVRELGDSRFRFYEEKRIKIGDLERVLGFQTFDFHCTACGQCCSGGGVVYFTKEDLKNIQESLKTAPEQPSWASAFLKGGVFREGKHGYLEHDSSEDCIFLEEGRCSIYRLRPLQCRTYPFWPSVFESKSSFKENKKGCPGMMKKSGKTCANSTVIRKTNATLRDFLSVQPPNGQYIEL